MRTEKVQIVINGMVQDEYELTEREIEEVFDTIYNIMVNRCEGGENE